MLSVNADSLASIIVGLMSGIAYSKTYTLEELAEEVNFYGALRLLMVMGWLYLLLIPILMVLFWNKW